MPRRADGGVGARPAVRPAAARGRLGRDTATCGDRCSTSSGWTWSARARRWPEPEYRFKHALIQEAAYRTLVGGASGRRCTAGGRVARGGVRGRDVDEVAGVARAPLAGGRGRGQGGRVPHQRRRPRAAGVRARRGDRALPRARSRSSERRGERREMALVLFKLALALHMSLRFAEANDTYQRAFELLDAAASRRRAPTATLRVATSFLPNDPDPRSAIAWPNIQLCMQLFDRLVEAWPERTIVPSLAERWEISDDGLRYVFHLREGWLVRRRAAHRARRRVRHQAGAEPGRTGLVGGDLLRAGERPGLLPATERRRRRDRRAGARRPHGRVPAGRAGAVLHERDEPPRRRAAAAPCDRTRRRRWTDRDIRS